MSTVTAAEARELAAAHAAAIAREVGQAPPLTEEAASAILATGIKAGR